MCSNSPVSDTKWRLSGGLGEPEIAAQVMTQGVGFPLRPVDGVPAQDSGENLEGLLIAEAIFMQWAGDYQAGWIYPTGFVVLDDGWTCISLVANVTKPAPQPVGDPTFSLPTTPAFLEESDLSTVHSGHEYTFTQSGWLRTARAWVTELSPTATYRVIFADVTDPNAIKTSVIEGPVLDEGAWKAVAFTQQLVESGTVLRVYLEALNSGSDTAVNGGWRCNGSDNNGAPFPSGWNYRSANDLIRIDKTDLEGTDRTTELLGMSVATTVQFSETVEPSYAANYTVTGAPVDQGTYFEYPVRLETTGPLGMPRTGEVTTMTALVPVAQATKYAELVGGVPTPAWATVTGILAFDGVDQGGGANAYGVDLEFDEAVINPEWGIVAFPG